MDLKRLFLRMAAGLLAAIFVFPCYVHGISAQKAIVMDAHTGRVLYEKQADSQSLIASTTKIMTALLVCEQSNVLDRMRIPKEAVGIEGSSIYLREGEILTLQELLYGMMLHSGNDAATALAIYCGGTVEGFAEMMNDKARSLGMTNSHFVNPHGLDAPGHYSTARDMAVLAAYAMENPIFAQTVSAKTVTAGGRALRNHNKLLWQVEGADGVKTGYTKAAGRILVSSATRQQRRLVAVTIHAPSDWQDHKTLLEEGFSRYQIRRIVNKGDVLGQMEIEGGVKDKVPLFAAGDFDYPLAQEEQLTITLSGAGFAYAPVVRGNSAGAAHIWLGDTCVGTLPLLFAETVEMEEEEAPNFWRRLFGGEG